jgi:hypothetical protein
MATENVRREGIEGSIRLYQATLQEGVIRFPDDHVGVIPGRPQRVRAKRGLMTGSGPGPE